MASVQIRPYAIGDEAALYDAAHTSWRELEPFAPWCHAGYSLADANAWVARQAAAFAAGSEFDFVIVDDGVLAGACALNQLDRVNRRANLGYWVRTSSMGRGVATAAVKLVVAWTFANTDLHRLEVVIATDNKASLRVAQKAGAAVEGMLRGRLLLHGVFHDAIMHSIVRP